MLWTRGVLPWQWYGTRQHQQQSYSSSCFAYTIVVSQNVSSVHCVIFARFRSFSLYSIRRSFYTAFRKPQLGVIWLPVEFQLSAKRARLSTVIVAIFIHRPITHEAEWVTRTEFHNAVYEKNENFDDMFSHFDTITACDRRTGGQINRWTVRPADRWHSW